MWKKGLIIHSKSFLIVQTINTLFEGSNLEKLALFPQVEEGHFLPLTFVARSLQAAAFCQTCEEGGNISQMITKDIMQISATCLFSQQSVISAISDGTQSQTQQISCN